MACSKHAVFPGGLSSFWVLPWHLPHGFNVVTVEAGPSLHAGGQHLIHAQRLSFTLSEFSPRSCFSYSLKTSEDWGQLVGYTRHRVLREFRLDDFRLKPCVFSFHHSIFQKNILACVWLSHRAGMTLNPQMPEIKCFMELGCTT